MGSSFDWSASAGGSAVHTDRTPTVGPSPVYNFLKRTISMRAGALRQSRGAKWNIASPVGEFCTGHHRQRAAAADCAGKKTRRKKKLADLAPAGTAPDAAAAAGTDNYCGQPLPYLLFHDQSFARLLQAIESSFSVSVIRVVHAFFYVKLL